jgi:hypothetical protein
MWKGLVSVYGNYEPGIFVLALSLFRSLLATLASAKESEQKTSCRSTCRASPRRNSCWENNS